jgi:hypothetical protein
LAAALLVALAMAAAWYQTNMRLREWRAGELRSIAALLQENAAILKELQSQPFTEKDSGILAAYLVKLRRDGVALTGPMKQRLDQLAENNAAIVALIRLYSAHAKAGALTMESDQFQHYAIAWRDRWNSVMEYFMAGGNFPVSQVPYPTEFLTAVDAELEAVQGRTRPGG